jgi:hypothetical protein
LGIDIEPPFPSCLFKAGPENLRRLLFFVRFFFLGL